jgi:hypothetical protein
MAVQGSWITDGGAVKEQSIPIESVQLDTSIQCRAGSDSAVVGEYAERMKMGDVFPPIDVYGTEARCWIGDGWHRVLAALQRGEETIMARVTAGGRIDALKHALSANSRHGQRRTNADKRRAVEIALREFPKFSSRAIAEMCGVSSDLVDRTRPQLPDSGSSTRTGLDGKDRPARRLVPVREEPSYEEPSIERPRFDEGPAVTIIQEKPAKKLAPPSNGLQFAQMAIMDLEQIRSDDVERAAAFDLVKRWIDERKD